MLVVQRTRPETAVEIGMRLPYINILNSNWYLIYSILYIVID